MKVALIQFDTVWENVQENLKTVNSLINGLEKDVDLAVLPEMFTTGFTMNPEAVADNSVLTLQNIQNLAVGNNLAIVGSWVTKESNSFYNRLYFVFPDGSYETYDKRHLFTLAGEDKIYQPGVEKLIVHYKGWKICPLVCYDLRFPVYSRIVNHNFDLLLYVASWPDRRIFAWDSLLKARAIENMSYVVAVNRVGEDVTEVAYSGHSQVVSYMGAYLQEPYTTDEVKIVVLNKEELIKARSKFAFLNDADDFTLLK